jgi:hypothetical protein
MAWHRYTLPPGRPCLFTPERTAENFELLTRTHGLGDLPPALIVEEHPLGHLWHSSEIDAYLRINALAEAIRLVGTKPGFSSVLNDLLDAGQCLPAWHTVHTAAMFENSGLGRVLEFVEPGASSRPDFILMVDGVTIPAEAKLLEVSEDEERFIKVSEALLDIIRAPEVLPPRTSVLIVLKKLGIATDLDALQQRCLPPLRAYSGAPLEARHPICNIFVEPLQLSPPFDNTRVFYALGRIPDSETLRVLGKAKKASAQLRSFPTDIESGILCLGLNDYQRGLDVAAYLDRRMSSGHLRSIAAYVLIKRKTQYSPTLTTVELLEFKRNHNAKEPIPEGLALRPLGPAIPMTSLEVTIPGLPAYRYAWADSGRSGSPSPGVFLPDIRILTPDLLR